MKRTDLSNSGVQDGVLVRVMVPKNNEKTPAAADLFFSALHGAYIPSTRQQPVMSFEIVSINKFTQFYFYVPQYLKEFVEGQLYAQYPKIEMTKVEDFASKILSDKSAIGCDLTLMKDDAYPIKTFQNFDVDPLSSLMSILSQVESDEELWIQVCVSPASDKWQKRGIEYAKAVRAGRNPSESFLRSLARGVFGAVRSAASQASDPNKPAANKQSQIQLSGPQQEAMGAIELKTNKLGFQSKIRIVGLSKDLSKSQRRILSLAGAFKQFNSTNINGFAQNELVSGEHIIDLYRARSVSPKPYVLNTEELASIYHLPSVSVETPSVDWVGSSKGEPPKNLPVIGTLPDESITVFGRTSFRNEEKEFGIKLNDRALHMYTIGKTGTGKSTFLSGMVIDDINKGRGVGVVDPHGDLIRDVMEYIPENRIQDVVYFAPADRDYPIGFNLLESVGPEYKNIIASGIVGIFKKIFGDSWGPRLEYILRNVVLGLLDYENATMLSIIRILTDTKFRREVIEKIDDPVIHDFFINEFERYDQKFRTEAIAPIQNKVGQFLSSSIVRNIVGQLKSTIDIRDIMDNKKILLLDLSIGKIGEDNSALLGSMLITKIQMSAMSRADLPKERRTPFYLYVDEFQNFATDSFAVIFSEARKYGLSLNVTNQYIAQMPETVSNAVFGNVGTLVVFRVGASDGSLLQREFVPVFEEADLVNLDNYNVYVKMAIDGITSTPFSAKSVLTEYKPTNLFEKIVDQSRIKYSASRAEVEESIRQRSASLDMVLPGVASTAAPAAKPAGELAEKKQINVLKQESAAPPGHETTGTQTSSEPIVNQESGGALQNVKEAEDYDSNRWYFLTRTDFRRATGKGIEEEDEPATKEQKGAGTDDKNKKDSTAEKQKGQSAAKGTK